MSGAMVVRIPRFILPTCKLQNLREIRNHFVRRNSSQASSKVLECLKCRSILRLRGKETSEFLQGLITNDMRHLEDGATNLYSLFLNTKGRVMYDAIVYKSQEKDEFYIECDSRTVDSLQKHLKMFKVRRRIDIESLEDKMNIWSFFDPNQYFVNKHVESDNMCKLEGLIFPCGTLNNKSSKVVNNIMIYEDPRVSVLGFRILAESNVEKGEITKHLNFDTSDSINLPTYQGFRYKLGIAEGIDDLPPGKPLPLEINCDYLHGVSFHKGCYIGQELTARTYHTGVVRKRLMPFTFDEVPNKLYTYEEKITDESGNVVGKFRGNEKEYGLGLMRITEALNARSLNISGAKIKVAKPIWWPQEVQKETVSASDTKR